MKQSTPSTLYRLSIALLTTTLLLTVLVWQVEVRMFRSSLNTNRALYEKSQQELARQKDLNVTFERWLNGKPLYTVRNQGNGNLTLIRKAAHEQSLRVLDPPKKLLTFRFTDGPRFPTDMNH